MSKYFTSDYKNVSTLNLVVVNPSTTIEMAKPVLLLPGSHAVK